MTKENYQLENFKLRLWYDTEDDIVNKQTITNKFLSYNEKMIGKISYDIVKSSKEEYEDIYMETTVQAIVLFKSDKAFNLILNNIFWASVKNATKEKIHVASGSSQSYSTKKSNVRKFSETKDIKFCGKELDDDILTKKEYLTPETDFIKEEASSFLNEVLSKADPIMVKALFLPQKKFHEETGLSSSSWNRYRAKILTEIRSKLEEMEYNYSDFSNFTLNIFF